MKHQLQFATAPCFKRWSRKGYGIFASLGRRVTIGVLSTTMCMVARAADGKTQAPADADSIATIELQGVGVTGARATSTRSLATQTPVFSRSLDGAAALPTIESALRVSPAVDVRERGGRSVQSDFLIRGGTVDQSMVTLNGINFTDARTGHQSHSLPVDMGIVSSIAVLDGVAGVGAYSGAIDISTSALQPNSLTAELSGGMHEYGYAALAGNVTRGRLSTMAAASFNHSGGYIENTGFTNVNAYARAQWAGLDVQAGYQHRSFGSNGFYSLAYPNQYEKTSTALASAKWHGSAGPWEWAASLSYRLNTDQFELIKGDPSKVPFNHHITDNWGAELSGSRQWAAGKTTIVADWAYNHIWSTVLGKLVTPKRIGSIDYNHEASRTVVNATLRHRKDFGPAYVAASGGYSHSPFGDVGLWSATAGWQINSAWQLDAGAVKSMRLPTFTDLYYTATNYVSDHNLRPEQAVTWHVSAECAQGPIAARAYLYYRHGQNLIDWVKNTVDAPWRATQLSKMDSYGIELNAAYNPRLRWLRTVQVSYGWITQSHDAGERDVISKYALDYMHNKASVRVDFTPAPRFTLSATGTLYDRIGNYADRDGQVRPYGTYFLLDAKATYSFWGPRMRAYVEATNLTGTRYFDYGGLEMPRCWATAGLILTL